MTFLVPFDGSNLAVAALDRAREFADSRDEAVVAVTVVPVGNAEYAREAGWLGHDERFDAETVLERLREQVAAVAPDATFDHESVGRYAPAGTIAKRLKEAAHERDASMVFIGSDNAGHIVTSVSSVGGAVAAGREYDVVIVRGERD